MQIKALLNRPSLNAYDTLLYVAFFCMILDHASILLEQSSNLVYYLKSIGRLAFPWFSWSLAYTLSKKTIVPWIQLNRMFITGIICIIPWNILIPGVSLNIFFTLLCSLLLIIATDNSFKLSVNEKVLIYMIVASSLFKVDYDIWGILITVTFYSVFKFPSFSTYSSLILILSMLSLTNDYPYAWISIPLGILILKTKNIPRIHPGMFYHGYVIHISILAVIKISMIMSNKI